jgi:hypothetical protein
MVLDVYANGFQNNFDLYRFDEPELPHNMRWLEPGEWRPCAKTYPTERIVLNGVAYSVDKRLIEKWEKENVQ